MHIILLLSSVLLLCLLILHSLAYRGKRVTFLFLGSCFLFGVLRGNVIYYICKLSYGNTSLPYVFTRPVISIGHASLQECIGWLFAVYLSWSLAEKLLYSGWERKTEILRTVCTAGVFMGAIAYAAEATALGIQWWVWGLSINNPWFRAVPFVGIIAWLSVIFDFLLPFLLIVYKKVSGWKALLLLLVFPVHMLLHLEISYSWSWLPFSLSDIWHVIIILTMLWGIIRGSEESSIPVSPPRRNTETDSFVSRHAIYVVCAGFIVILLIAQALVSKQKDLLISLVPFITGVLFFRPYLATAFCLSACLVFGIITGSWSYTAVPLGCVALFYFSRARLEGILTPVRRFRLATGVTIVFTGFIYAHTLELETRKNGILTLGTQAIRADTTQASAIFSQFPRPSGSDIEAYNLLADLAYRQQNYIVAERFIELAIQSDPTYSRQYFNAALLSLERGDNNKAINTLEKAIELNPFDPDSYLLLGEIFEQLGRIEDSREVYHKGLSMNKKDNRFEMSLQRVLSK